MHLCVQQMSYFLGIPRIAWKIMLSAQPFFPTEANVGIKIVNLEAALEQLGTNFATFMLLEQLGAGKRNPIKNAQYAPLSHPWTMQQQTYRCTTFSTKCYILNKTWP